MWDEIYTTLEAARYVNISYWEMATLLRYKVISSEKRGCAFFILKSNLDKWVTMQKKHKETNHNEYSSKNSSKNVE